MANKFPELDAVQKALEAAREVELARLAPLVAKREAIVAQIQPLEAELRTVNKAITAMERERLSDVGAQLAALAKVRGAMSVKNG